MRERRRFLKLSGAGAIALASRAFGQSLPRMPAYPFSLGVAAGYPGPNGVVLWSRLAPDPRRPDGGLDPLPIPVRWEISADDGFRHVVTRGEAVAVPEWAHSAHIEVSGLESNRWYWYRFLAGDAVSPVGRFRTAPVAAGQANRLRFAVGSCQQYEQGYYAAWRSVAADTPDLVAFLGDYIYESSWGTDHVRKHGAPECRTLDEYRVRHALYRSDPDLQAAHHVCAWLLTWDDHEVVNDYADNRPAGSGSREAFLERRSAGYRAYYEHMPLPSSMRPDGPNMRIYTALDWGSLARFHVLDGRQYRSWQACTPADARSARTVDPERCAALGDATRSYLGRAQERWLAGSLLGSTARWNLLAQQTLFSRLDRRPGPGRIAWGDGWDGYPAARQRLIDRLAAGRSGDRISNPVILGGDVHAFYTCDVLADFDDPASSTVATEFVGTSITSQGSNEANLQNWLPENPHIRFADSRYRGYLLCDVSPRRMTVECRAIAHVRSPDAPGHTLARFAVEDGRPGAQRV